MEKMTDSPNSQDISTKLERIAKQAREIRDAGLQALAHYIDVNWMREAYRRTRKDGVPPHTRTNAWLRPRSDWGMGNDQRLRRSSRREFEVPDSATRTAYMLAEHQLTAVCLDTFH
ncbi:MAG: hypothetical protein ABJE66_34780 [Deltaproteobacteria bacterium]